jgi:hypothetical protein
VHSLYHHPLHYLARICAANSELGALVNIEDVEIVQTGLEYKLASGPKTFTTDDLKDAVASQNDAAIKAPRLKLGHVANIGLLADGQPAIGTIGDLRLEKNGHLVVGTYLGVPEWLAKVLPSAYPARSIEALTGVKTNTGHKWRLVITDLALLGVVWPGVSTLDDIEALYSKDGPDDVTIYTTKEEFTAARVQAQINNDDVLRQYREQKTPEQMFWWVHSMMRDPDELIVEDEAEGQLYRIPYSIKGETITFDDPIPVKIVYKDKSKRPIKSEQAEQAARAAISVVLATGNREEFNRMTLASGVDPAALRNALGLEDDATDEEVQTALEAAGFVTPPGREVPSGSHGRAAGSEQPGTTDSGAAAAHSSAADPDVESPDHPRNDPRTSQPTVTPTAASAAPAAAGTAEVVHLDRATYERLLAGAETAERLDTTTRHAQRDQIIAQAVSDTKIEPSRIDHWRRKYDEDPEGTRHLLTASFEQGGLAPGVVPVAAMGVEQSVEDTSAEAYPPEWLPEVHNRQAQGGGIASE